MTIPNVIWHAPALDPSGYGEATRGYLGVLATAAVKVRLCNQVFAHGLLPRYSNLLMSQLSKMANTEIDFDDAHVSVQHLTPDQYQVRAGRNCVHVGMTTFETDRIPAGWHAPMRAMDEIWTHSRWGKSVMERAGIRRPIQVIHHGVDTDKFSPITIPLLPLKKDLRSCFVFGSNFDWTPRKNPKALLHAYLNTFRGSNDVALVLKTSSRVAKDSQAFIKGQIQEARSECGSKVSPRIVLLSDTMPESMMPSFYTTLDCYVLPSRGEGWGLTFSEAMATGLPTIGVNWSGNTEFMNDQNSILLKNFKLTTVTPREAGPFTQYIGHQWADCDVEELGQAMRDVFEKRNPDLGRRARCSMKDQYRWPAVTAQMINRLNALGALLP